MRSSCIILIIGLSCLGGCASPTAPSGDINAVQQWVQSMSNERADISEVLDLMDFPFNSDGKLLSREEAKAMLTEWRQILLSPAWKVSWSNYQRLSETAPDHPLRHSFRLKERADKSPQPITSMVLVFSHAVCESLPSDNTDGNVFFIDSAGKIVGMSN